MRKFCHSEREARMRTCPLTFSIPEQRGEDGSGIREAGPWGCVGADCMAWRFVETHIKDESGDLTVLSGDTHGYCGLAGDPR